MKVHWVILSGFIIAGIIAIGVSQIDEPAVIESNEEKSVGVTSTLIPETRVITPTITTIESQSFEAEFDVEELSTQSIPQFSYLQSAYAVTPTQTDISLTTWPGGLGRNIAFDLSRNFFTAAENGQQIAFNDISDNSKKTWTLPNDDKVRTWHLKMAVDSNGNVFFSKTDVNGNIDHLTRLNPSTNVFTEWNQDFRIIGEVFIDSSDNVFFTRLNGNVYKLDPTTNTLTTWTNPNGGIEHSDMDSSGNIYLTNFGGKLGILNTNTNVVTTWTVTTRPGSMDVDLTSPGNLFFAASDGARSKVGRISIADNTLTEWVIPNTSTGTIQEITVDSMGNVFIASNGFTRFVPSTGVFTVFSGVNCNIIEIDSSDNIFCSTSSGYSKIT